MSGNGPAFYSAGNIDTYRNLTPRSAQPASGALGVTTALIVTGALIALGAGAWLYVRRRPSRTEEEVPEAGGAAPARRPRKSHWWRGHRPHHA